MAQSGYTPILIYASGTTGNTPSAANMTSSASGAELALNYFDGKLFYKDASGNVQLLASKSAAGATISFGTTGLTPNTATPLGNVTVAGTLVVGNGGTGLTSLTAGYIPFGNGTSAFSSSANLYFDGTNLGIGTSSPSQALTVGNGTADKIVLINGRNSGTGAGASVICQNGGASTIAIGNSSGIIGGAYDGNAMLFAGSGLNQVFFVNSAERMRIDSSGNLLVGTTDNTYTYKSVVSFDGAGNNGFVVNNSTGSGVPALFNGKSAGVDKFYVVNSGAIYSTSTSITAISDLSQKENIRNVPYGLSSIQNLKPVQFDFKENCGSGNKNLLGFIAQDVEKVIPELVSDGFDGLKTLKMGDMLPVLVKAIQEQQALIENLTTRLNSLEGK